MQSPFIEAALLGVLQGITEFLPVSSDGHLALAEMLFQTKGGGLALNVTLHLGTLLATALVLRDRLAEAFMGGLRALRNPRLFQTTPGGQDALVIIVASVPTAVIGLVLRHPVERFTESPVAVGLGFLVTTGVLVSTLFTSRGNIEHPSWRTALLIGIAQGMAVLPGVSRSASTIAVALWLGTQRGRAFELSMLMSLPAILGALILEMPKAAAEPGTLMPALFGAAVAFVTGVFALMSLRRIVSSGKFPWFAAWVGPLALATLALGLAWPS
jgi:undecaprenyl-diphosphatase